MNLLLRADASVQMGTGHVMRCLALAQAWQDAGGQANFAMGESTPAVAARLTNESCEIMQVSDRPGTADDANHVISLWRERRADWVVVDGYQFGAEYQRVLKDAGCRVLFLDDYGHADHYFVDVVLNQNIYAEESLYKQRELETQLLLGPQYCLLRREFSVWRQWKREIANVCTRLLVLMGGSDPENLAARVIDALTLAQVDVDTTVVVGGSSPHLSALKRMANSMQKVTVVKDVTDMAGLMAASDVAVSAAGSTCWELCLLGLPALVIDVAANQTAVARELDRLECAVHVGDHSFSPADIATQLKRLIDSRELRQSLSRRSKELVDCNGAARVVSLLLDRLAGECEEHKQEPASGPASCGSPTGQFADTKSSLRSWPNMKGRQHET